METTCSNKIVSLHLERCGLENCPHQSICYLRNRKDEKRTVRTDISYFVRKGYRVYNAICNKVTGNDLWLLNNYKNYNITLSYNLFKEYDELKDEKIKDQIQVTVYNEEQLKELNNQQKLYLVKDEETLSFFYKHINLPWKNIHFPIDQSFIDKKKIIEMSLSIISSNNNITLDSCLTQIVKEHHCIYGDNYIDINYDGTIRKCVFDKEGMYFGIREEDMEKAFDISIERNCIYKRII